MYKICHQKNKKKKKKKKNKTAVVGGGCFWCTEAVFQEIKGVEHVVSGYAGGTVPGTPTYREICSGLTGHAEVVKISFNPNLISYEEVIGIFMTTHDPTSLNKQGADTGTQYRSVIFYQDSLQEGLAKKVIQEVGQLYDAPIVTELSKLPIFHEAEPEHQNYYKRNAAQRYCSYVISPKLQQLRALHASKLK